METLEISIWTDVKQWLDGVLEIFQIQTLDFDYFT